ncbi:MAG: Uncharacterized protein XD63_1236 [Thermoanaerobacterales bacterium 50_218]|nr:MAG: Uncharacterized protein XD63_1236 [Thermoanaerobacterales bacterium 50_218]
MRDSFLRGAFILTVAGIIVKLLGVFYRIPFTRMVGSEGIGLYQMAYPIYATILALSTSGLPVAISYLVAEKRARGDFSGARVTFFLSLGILFILGMTFSVVLFRSAYYLAVNLLGDTRAYYPLFTVAPAILVVSVASAFRGYFQGCQVMWPTAVSQVAEQVVRVATVFWAGICLLPKGVEFAAAGATFGAVTGGFSGLLVLVAVFLWFEKTSRPPGHSWKPGISISEDFVQILRRLFSYALPISAGSLVMPVVQAIDTMIIPHRLQDAGCSVSEATSLFGQFSGMAGSLVFLPVVFTAALATSLVPSIAAAYARKDQMQVRRGVSTSVRITVALVLPAAVGIALLATPMTTFLFADPGAGEVTSWLAPAAFFSGLYQTTSGALQGLGCTWIPVINLVVGCLVKIFCNYYLTVFPVLGVKGAAVGSVFCFLVASLLNDFSLRLRVWGYSGFFPYLSPSLLAATIMGVMLPQVYGFLKLYGNGVATCASIFVGACVYFLFFLGFGGVKLSSLRKLF